MRNPERCQNRASRCLTGCLSSDESGNYPGGQVISDFRRIWHSSGHRLRCAPDFPQTVDSRRLVGGRRRSAVFFLRQPSGLFHDLCRERRDGSLLFPGKSDCGRDFILHIGEFVSGPLFCMAHRLSVSFFCPYCEKNQKNTCQTQKGQLD